MAFWKAPWNTVFAHSAERTDDNFSIVDAADATSQFGIKSLPSETCDAFDPVVPAHGYPWDALNDQRKEGSVWSGYLSHGAWDESLLKSCYEDYPFDDERHYSTLTRCEANALENAGRHNDGHPFQDLRSADKNRKRCRNNAQKYYGYRVVNRGQLGSKHKASPQPTSMVMGVTLPADMATHTVNKQDLYNMAQDYPRPPRYHRRAIAKDSSPWSIKVEARQQARKHACQDWDLDEEMTLAYDVDHCDYDLPQQHAEWLDEQRRMYAALQAKALKERQERLCPESDAMHDP